MLDHEQQLVEVVVAGAELADSPIHGQGHWRAVAATGLRLAETTPGADPEVLVLFGLFHDCRRENEGSDPDHGRRGGQLARELQPVCGGQLELLVDACTRHTGAPADTDPTIGCCFDADRLGLVRIGAMIDPQWLSTLAALDEDTAEWAATLHLHPPTWTDLFAQARDAAGVR